jgi:hypothetical protein
MKISLGYLAAALAALAPAPAIAQMGHDHAGHGGAAACTEPTLACAAAATPAFGPDGALWLAWASGGRISVARSPDLGRTFAPAVAVNPQPLRLDTGPDERPKIVLDAQGRIFVGYAIFKDSAFNGQVFHTRSTDGGRSFAPPRPITTDQESQRFETLALDSDGALFVAWLDKRNRVPARQKGETYVGAALAFAWSKDDGATFSETRIAHDNTCECCRLGVAFAGPGRPVVLFRNVFGENVRDHAIVAFADATTPGPVRRVSVDDWAIDACPHHGPSVALSSAGAYHVAWFTNGRARQGLFYAASRDQGGSFSAPMPIGQAERSPSRPYLLAASGTVWLVWKEFDGEETSVRLMVSHDEGGSWSAPRTIAHTRDASDHPLLIANGATVFLSWQTRADGYRLIALEDKS